MREREESQAAEPEATGSSIISILMGIIYITSYSIRRYMG